MTVGTLGQPDETSSSTIRMTDHLFPPDLARNQDYCQAPVHLKLQHYTLGLLPHTNFYAHYNFQHLMLCYLMKLIFLLSLYNPYLTIKLWSWIISDILLYLRKLECEKYRNSKKKELKNILTT